MEEKINIRPYEQNDEEAVVALLRLNTPAYFAPEEEKDFLHYLKHEIEAYFVMFSGQTLIGCGGLNVAGNQTIGKISWDIFHPNYQGKGFGSMLLQFRLEKLKNSPDIKTITVRTSQQAYKFYEKNGFVLQKTIRNYWAPGFDLYEMEYQH